MDFEEFELAVYDLYLMDANQNEYSMGPIKSSIRVYLEEETYTVWAVRELLSYIKRNMKTGDRLPEFCVLIKEFRETMKQYSKRDKKSSVIFKYAVIAADNVMDFINAMD